LEDDDTDVSMSSEAEEEEPPCGPLQAALLGSFERAHRETSTRAVHAITLEKTNVAIASRAAKILVEFTAKEAASQKLMGPNDESSGSSKRRRRATPTTLPSRHTGDGVEWRLKRRRRRRGLR
jgi:hypothetical protein